MKAAATAAFIRARMPRQPVPGLPDLALHKATPSSGIGRFADPDGAPPYWAYWWAGGLALALHLRAQPDTVRGRRVFDLGAGSGLVGIVAALAGAASVGASEIDSQARVAIALNATAHGVTIDPLVGDILDQAPPTVDLLLVGDLFYAPDLAARVMPFLDHCRGAGIEVLIGDPWRAPLPCERMTLLAEYAVAETGATIRTGVFRYEG